MYEKDIIRDVQDYTSSWGISTGSGMGCLISKKSATPVVGDIIEIETTNYNDITSIRLNGIQVVHRTPEIIEQNRIIEIEKIQKQRKDRYTRMRLGWEVQIKSLNIHLRNRIQRFIDNDNGFEHFFTVGSGPYELFTCVEADKLIPIFSKVAYSKGLHTYAELAKYVKENEEELCTVLSDDHSGNTWAGAIQLAIRVVTGVNV